MKKNHMAEIIELEWKMFSAVRNVGGPAACQLDPETFGIMRRSQLETWPEDLRVSYQQDLLAAETAGRNLMTEKYAWAMEFAFPEEFAAVAPGLPQVDAKALELIEEIVAVSLDWKTSLQERFPRLSSKGRPLHTRSDSRFGTSFETYLRSELKTYSPGTLRRYHAFVLDLQSRGLNQVEQILLAQVRQYGYSSLEDAEKRSA